MKPPVTKMTLPARSGISLSGLKVIPPMIKSRNGGWKEYLYLDEVLYELMAQTQTTIYGELSIRDYWRSNAPPTARKSPTTEITETWRPSFGPAFRTSPRLNFSSLTP
jgi:hypothetical protein